MKVHARFHVESVGVACPKCGEPIAVPTTGSQVWTLADIRALPSATVNCDCGADVFIVLPRGGNVRVP